MVGPKAPLDAGPQHTQDHTTAFQAMLRTVRVERVRTPEGVTRAYTRAMTVPGSVLIVESPA